MDSDKQLERQLEKELDEMPVQDLDDDTYDEYDLIVIPDQGKTSPKQAHSDAPQPEQHTGAPKTEDLGQRMRPTWPPSSAGGGDVTTIELISSDDEPSVEEAEGGDGGGGGDGNASSSDDVGVIEDSDSELSSDSDSASGGNQLERSYQELNALPNKQFAQMVTLIGIAFKLNDLEKIESSVLALQQVATVPAHVWLKYLKARLVVTQTAEERKAFEEKCAKALSYYYSIPLSEYIVNYLVDQGNVENHVLWAKLLADYDVERPDFGDKLRTLLATITDEKEAAAFEELLQKHCVSWKCSQEQRQLIQPIVDEFKRHLDEIGRGWDWSETYKRHVVHVEALSLDDDDLKNAVIRFIFERSVAKFPIVDVLWLSYIEFIQGSDGGCVAEEDDETAELTAKRASRLGKGYLRNTALDLAKRGVRSRPSVQLNHRYLDLMERADFEQPEVEQQIRAILERIVPDMDMTVELHLDYLAYCVRNTNAGDEQQAASLRAAFNRVWEELSALYGDEADTRYEVLQLWAQVEYTHLASPANGWHIWRQIMGYPGSSHRGLLWLGFAQMESEYNAGQGTRDVLREALSQPVLEDGIMVQELYRRYERCYGTYESIAACQALDLPAEYLKPRSRIKPNTQTANSRQQKQQHQPRQQQQPRQQTQSNSEPLNREQRRRQAHEQQQQLKQGQKKRPPPTQAAKTETSAGGASPPTSRARGPASAQGSDAEARESNFKYSPNMEINKIFVRNLHPACSKEELHELFSPFGSIKDVRLVHKLNKQFKGIAYVEFEKPGEAQRAVAGRDGHLLKGMNISVAISNPPPRGSASDVAKPSVAPKRRVPTSLIPTTLVRQEVAAKKRRLLLVEPGTSTADAATEHEANGGAAVSLVEQKAEEEPAAAAAAAPKSNDDFRKLFLKD
ncbi:RNA-binding protein 4F [Drosophila santomea]|uniref:RNA-binding protein 4F n=1 Tax=Drosophila santomea TaxID=129105 RepID=UPI0019541CAF|nr:RNA-binding protein 4F [Drosophila santomea]